MPIRDKNLQHTDLLAPLGSLQHLLVLIEVIISYNDNSAFGPLIKVMAFSCQTSQFTDITLGTVCNTHFPVS